MLAATVACLRHRHLALVEQLLPTTFASTGSRRRQAGPGPFPDQLPLELGQCSEDAAQLSLFRGDDFAIGSA